MPHMRWPTGRDRFRAKNDFCHRRFLVFRDAASSSITHSRFYQSNQIRTWTKKGKSKKKKVQGQRDVGWDTWLIDHFNEEVENREDAMIYSIDMRQGYRVPI